MRLIPALVLLVALASPQAVAQCTVSGAAFQTYGTGCNSVFPMPASLSGAYDPAGCSLDITLSAFPGCCNTFLVERIFVAGLSPAATPLPFLGAGCTVLVQPLNFAAFPASAGETISFPLPPGTPAFTLYLQGVTHYFTTIGFTHDYGLTNGLRIDVL